MGRASRWDRPPLPKDVRWFIRLVGKVLICTGLLMFGFVGYQLWGTGLEYARAQNRLDDQFDRLLEGFETVAADSLPGEPTATEPAATEPAAAAPPASPGELPVRDFSYVSEYPVGQLWVPTIGIEGMNIVAGVGRDDLKEGPGHFSGTSFPGEFGNAALAGHRTTYGAPFEDLPDVEIGDELAVLTPYGNYTYRMIGFEVVNPEDSHVVATTDPTSATLTLVTCTPKGTAQQRYILYAELVPEQSDELGRFVDRALDDLGAGGTGLPGDELNDDESPAPTSTPAATEPAPTETVPFEEVPLDEDTIDRDSIDTGGFNSHWFDDADAWPHIAAWGLACAGFVAGAYLLARRLRNSWVGLAVGIAPFAFTLYFFYQNVNRLLPAAL